MAGFDQDTNQLPAVASPLGDGDNIGFTAENTPMGTAPAMGGLSALPATPAANTPQPMPVNPMGDISSRLNGLMASKSALSDVRTLLEQKEQAMNQIPWFQLAAAFLNPGRTGSFGESLGGAAGELGKWNQMRQEQMIPLATAKADIAQKEIALQNQIEAQKGLVGILGGVSPAPAAGLQPTGAMPMGTTPMQAPQTLGGAPVAPQTVQLTPEMIARNALLEGEDPQKILQDFYKNKLSEREQATKEAAEKVAEQGVKANLRGFGAEQTISLDKKQELEKLAEEANKTGNWNKYVDYARSKGMPIYTNADGTPMYPHEIATAASKSTKQAELEIQDTQKYTDAALQKKDSANAILPHINAIQQYAQSNPGVFDRLKGAGIYDSFLNVAEKGISIPGVGSVGLDKNSADQLLQSLGKGKLSNDDLRVARLIAPHLAAIAYETVQSAKGSQISIPRQRLIEQLKPSAEDDSQSMRIKAEGLKFEKLADIAKAEAWGRARKQGMSSTDFMLSKEYNDIERNLLQQHTDLAAQVASIYGSRPQTAKPAKSSVAVPERQSPAAGFTERARKLLNPNGVTQ
jgi:hypothetical protein